MRIVRDTLLVLFSSMLLTCMTSGKLIGNDPAPAYFDTAYSVKNASTRMIVLNQSSYESFMKMFKEAIVNDSSLTAAQRDEQFAALKNYAYKEQLYLAYIIYLNTAVPLHVQEFAVSLNDDSGSTAIDLVLSQSVKVTTRTDYGTSTDYDYAWLIKLKKPFGKANFNKDSYQFTVTYPNGATGTYELRPK